MPICKDIALSGVVRSERHIQFPFKPLQNNTNREIEKNNYSTTSLCNIDRLQNKDLGLLANYLETVVLKSVKTDYKIVVVSQLTSQFCRSILNRKSAATSILLLN